MSNEPSDPAEKPDEEPTTTPEAPEPVEAEAEAKEPEAETEETEEEPRRSRTSGYARLKARHQSVLAELDRMRAAQQQRPAEEAPKEPKLDDFNGDYLAYERATVAHEARQAIREEMARARQEDFATKQAQEKHELVSDFFERAEEVKGKLPDFDKAVNDLYAQIGPLSEGLRDLIASSDQGPVILYHLAKNPSAARDLNSYGIVDAAREVGRLEAKLSPAPKKETKAPPPLSTPKGGASPPRDVYGLAKSSERIDDYVKARLAQLKKDGA